MLDNSREMLEYALETLTEKGKAKGGKKNIYLKDQAINLTERDIRKKILLHLATNPQCNLPACLMLISLAKDAERLGDYVKNIFDLKKKVLHNKKDDSDLFQRLFEERGHELIELFIKASDSFKNSDRELALEVMDDGYRIAEKCEDIISEIAESDKPAREVVVLALGSRYMKRIASHLSNIASSIVNPLTEIDYHDMS